MFKRTIVRVLSICEMKENNYSETVGVRRLVNYNIRLLRTCAQDVAKKYKCGEFAYCQGDAL